MPLPPLPVTLLLLSAMRFTPESVPARGAQESILTLDQPARVALSARSSSGTSCELVDHVRGPFAQGGTAGRSNCELDLLLDAGTYKLRLNSRLKGKGQVTLQAQPYSELNPQPVRLLPRSEVRQQLAPRQQASYWLHLEQRQPVTLRVSGRTAGDIRLWRSGQWLEPVAARDTSPRPRAGQPIHEWWLETTLEAGSYLLTVYGTSPQAWTEGKEDDTLSVAYGFPQAPPTRSLSVTLPAWGLAAVELPAEPVALFLTRESSSQSSARVSLHSVSGDGSTNVLSSPEASCQIAPKALAPQCSALATSSSRHVALLRGEPGTRLTLQWARYANDTFLDGAYGYSSTLSFRAASSGEHLVGLHEVPLDTDSAPLGCMLEVRDSDGDWSYVARDVPTVDVDRPLRRPFNYDGESATLWFEVLRSGRYTFATSGERKSRCELYRVEGDKRTRLTESDAKAETCSLKLMANSGVYELKLYGGTEGIDRITLAADARPPQADTATRSACLLPRVSLRQNTLYRVLTNRAPSGSLRGLYLRPLPLSLSEPLPVVLDGSTPVELPVQQGVALEVRSAGGEPFACRLGGSNLEVQSGRCAPPSSGGRLALAQSGQGSVPLWLQRPPPPPPPPPALSAFSPSLSPPPALQPATPMYFDFEHGQAHSLTFDVQEAGLYHVTTLGLLSTECSLRTPVVTALTSASGGGRGRNCLVSSYLRPGRYLLTARTTGKSKGRAGVLLERREIKRAEPVRGEVEVFFRSEAGDLMQQQLTVYRAATYNLSTAALGAELQCRLDDPQGWPVVTVPTPCSQTLRLGKGSYLWTQLPLTVESMRRTALERVRSPRVLRGNKPHTLRFNSWYQAQLGEDGKDEFSFEVPAQLELSFTLTNGMQGRLYSVAADGSLKPVELIAPQELPAPATPQYSEQEGSGESEESSSEEYSESESESTEGEGAEESSAPSYEEPTAQVQAVPVPAAPEGVSVWLEPGRYKLVAEHSRGDVAIAYSLYLRTQVLVPPMRLEVAVPGSLPLVVPVDGTLRLNTSGNADVRCRIFDADNRLVAENADRGADWNCSLAEPLPAGEYTLVLESQTLVPGLTRIYTALAEVKEAGELAPTGTVEVKAGVVRALLPPGNDEVVQELTFRAPAPFSCALEDERGAVVARQMDVKECLLLLRPGSSTWRVRLWTVGRPTKVSTSLVTRPLRPLSGSRIAPNEAALAQVPQPGRHATGQGVYCLPAAQYGPLWPCGPEASLEAGRWLFSPTGTGEGSLALTERVDTLATPQAERTALTRQVSLLRQRSRESALHLLRVSVPFGDSSHPACRLEGGTSWEEDFACYAATGPTQSSLARWWTAADAAGEATVTRLALPVPTSSVALQPGLQEVSWPGGPTTRLVLPTEPARVQLSLPPQAWAVQVDERGNAVDLCPPAEALSRCVLGASGGALYLWSPSVQRVQAEVLAVEQPRQVAALSSLYEATFRTPGLQRLTLSPAESERRLVVSGAARCVLTLDDGTRQSGCDTQVPPGRGGELRLEAEPGGLRAVLAPGAALAAATLSAPPGAQSPAELPAARALNLSGHAAERTFTLKEEAAVHLRSESGVCGLAQGTTVLAAEGMGRGCNLSRVLPAGTYRFLVRAFAGQPLSGSMSWTQEPVKTLKEGVATEESWVAPGQTRYFRFSTEAAGKVGLGLQVPAEVLECTVLDASQRVLGEGCQQFLSLQRGSYLLAIHAPDSARPLPFKPVLVGLAGTRSEISEEYLQNFFQRIGAEP